MEILPMIEWRFGESQDDGDAWMQRPEVFHVYVDYKVQRSGQPVHWRRLMVATKGWLMRQVADVQLAGAVPRWAALPTMLIVPDAPSDQLRRIVDFVIQQGGFDHYSAPLEQPTQSPM